MRLLSESIPLGTISSTKKWKCFYFKHFKHFHWRRETLGIMLEGHLKYCLSVIEFQCLEVKTRKAAMDVVHKGPGTICTNGIPALIHMMLVLQACRMRSLWSHNGFHQDFKGKSERSVAGSELLQVSNC